MHMALLPQPDCGRVPGDAAAALLGELKISDDDCRPPTPSVALVAPSAAKHGRDLGGVTSDPAVMQWVADGAVWDARKLKNFFRYCANEETQPDRARKNYYHVIEADGRCVGVVGIHPVLYDSRVRGEPYLTIFLSPQIAGRGVGTLAAAAALADYWRRHPARAVGADILADNYTMLMLAEKLGFEKVGKRSFGGKHYLRYTAARR